MHVWVAHLWEDPSDGLKLQLPVERLVTVIPLTVLLPVIPQNPRTVRREAPDRAVLVTWPMLGLAWPRMAG